LLWRGDSVWREDYNKNQPRDSRGRWSSGGGGGGKKSGGGGGGLASKKVSELQEIAKEAGIDPDTLSHKRRKSVLAAAIEAKRKGKDLREAGLLKPTKTKGGLRGQSKKKPQGLDKKTPKKSSKPKPKEFDPAKDGELEPAIRKERNRLMMTDESPPKSLAPLSGSESAKLEAMNFRLSKIAESGTFTASDREYMKKIGVPRGQESVWARSNAIKSADSPNSIKTALLSHGLNYAQSTMGDYGQLYNRTVADKLTKLGNKDLAEVSSKYYMGSLKAGQPLKARALETAPSVLTSELKRRGMLDADNPGDFKGKRVGNDWSGLTDKDFTFGNRSGTATAAAATTAKSSTSRAKTPRTKTESSPTKSASARSTRNTNNDFAKNLPDTQKANYHAVKDKKEFEDLIFKAIDDEGTKDKSGGAWIYNVREKLGESVPRDKFNDWLKEMQAEGKVQLSGGSAKGSEPNPKFTQNVVSTPLNGLRFRVEPTAQGREAVKAAGKNKTLSKKYETLTKNSPPLDPLGSARAFQKGKPIKSQADFDKETTAVFKRLNDEFQEDGRVPIYKVKEALGNRISDKEFNDFVWSKFTPIESAQGRAYSIPLTKEQRAKGIKTMTGETRDYLTLD